jgi:hypothetical protein
MKKLWRQKIKRLLYDIGAYRPGIAEVQEKELRPLRLTAAEINDDDIFYSSIFKVKLDIQMHNEQKDETRLPPIYTGYPCCTHTLLVGCVHLCSNRLSFPSCRICHIPYLSHRATNSSLQIRSCNGACE